MPKYAPPRFSLDKTHEYYGFVFGFDGICVAHGGDAANVGRTLSQVFHNVSDMDTAELHERFMRAADAGGGWCTYAWRVSATEVRLKGAYIVGATIDGRKCYAGVGYVLCPPESAGKSMGLYGFVCSGDGTFAAHGGSKSFIGSSLHDVVARTNNHSLGDPASLLDRFTTAARLGGGWVEYLWRNAPEEPLLTKGAYILRVELASAIGASSTLRKSLGASSLSMSSSYAS